MVDLFDKFEDLPIEVQKILNSFNEDCDNTYTELERLLIELKPLGYTFNYGLDGEPYELRLLTEFDTWSVERIDKVFEYWLDDLHPLDSVRLRNEVRTTDEKIIFFIEQEEKFKNSFK
jgi:hypothetical protein